MASPYSSPGEAPQPPVGLEGYLSKQGGGTSAFGRKNWKVRYFVLKNGVLSYYENKKASQASEAPKGSFHVLSISSIKTMPHKDKKFSNQCHREIVLPNRSLVVCCDQEEILKKWVDAINAHIRYERKTEHLKKIQIEAQMVEDEMTQQMAFTIMYNVLKRWRSIEMARQLQSWRMAWFVEKHGSVDVAETVDAQRIRAEFEKEKKEEMQQFADAVKAKWEDAVVTLKEEMQGLKDENATLRVEIGTLQEAALQGAAEVQVVEVEKPKDRDTVEVLRHEFVALMEASMAVNEGAGDGEVARELQNQIYTLEADLKLHKSLASSAQEQAEQQAQRADSLSARLEAAEDALRTMNLELEMLRENKSKPPLTPPPPPSPPKPTKSVSPRTATDASGWIARYKAIVNSPL